MDGVKTFSFGEWVKQRRTRLHLTQQQLALSVHCSTAMIKKIEGDERRPAPELAQLLAAALQLPADKHPVFVAIARGEQPLDALRDEGNGQSASAPLLDVTGSGHAHHELGMRQLVIVTPAT